MVTSHFMAEGWFGELSSSVIVGVVSEGKGSEEWEWPALYAR